MTAAVDKRPAPWQCQTMRFSDSLTNTFRRDPDLPFLEWRTSLICGAPFTLHSHEACSVAVVRAGSTTLVCPAGQRPVPAGTLVYLPPNEPHACNPSAGETLDYRKYYFAPQWFADFRAGLARRQGFAQRSVGGAGGELSALVRSGAALDAFEALAYALDRGAPAGAKQALLSAALTGLLSAPADLLGEAVRPQEREAVARAAALMEQEPAQGIRLEALARAGGLTPCHLLRVFKRARGMTPHAFQTQLRVNLAKRLLADGAPIAQAALEAGFVDQSHLNRVFRRFVGATPGQYVAGKNG